MNKYLESSLYIDWQTPEVLATAQELASGAQNALEVARRCFEFVRDEVNHSWDYRENPVTCKASEVLKHRTGYCYAKSHLLAALCRANHIPAGLCYQRLTVAGASQFCLHGLNAIYLADVGWYRIDARGNKEGVSAQFTPPIERLAYPITAIGEADLPEVWSEPLTVVTQVLVHSKTYQDVADNLPDVELVTAYQ